MGLPFLDGHLSGQFVAKLLLQLTRDSMETNSLQPSFDDIIPA